MSEKNVSRRHLLKATGAGAVAAGLTGFAHAKSAQGVKWDQTYEVVVVGSGGAGMAAAVKAAQNGAKKVIVLGKLAFTGGGQYIVVTGILECSGSSTSASSRN